MALVVVVILSLLIRNRFCFILNLSIFFYIFIYNFNFIYRVPKSSLARISVKSSGLASNWGFFNLQASKFNNKKCRLICKARGEPRPMIKWFKEGAEMHPKPNVHYYEKPLGKNEIWFCSLLFDNKLLKLKLKKKNF